MLSDSSPRFLASCLWLHLFRALPLSRLRYSPKSFRLGTSGCSISKSDFPFAVSDQGVNRSLRRRSTVPCSHSLPPAEDSFVHGPPPSDRLLTFVPPQCAIFMAVLLSPVAEQR
jgi:hypothetical protein